MIPCVKVLTSRFGVLQPREIVMIATYRSKRSDVGWTRLAVRTTLPILVYRQLA